MDKIYLGIDPGITGALAVLSGSHRRIYDFSDGQVMVALRDVNLDLWNKDAMAMIERVNPMPAWGASSSWKFGVNFGQWIGRLEALDIPFGFVMPKRWQKVMLGSMPKIHKIEKKKKVVDYKSMSLERVRQLFPAERDYFLRKKDHNRAEALLLAEYCKLMDKGVI